MGDITDTRRGNWLKEAGSGGWEGSGRKMEGDDEEKVLEIE